MVLASPETVQRLEKQISGFGSFSGRTKADLWFWLFHNPYNDLNSRFLVLASFLAVQRLDKKICGFSFSFGRNTADLWFWLSP